MQLEYAASQLLIFPARGSPRIEIQAAGFISKWFSINYEKE